MNSFGYVGKTDGFGGFDAKKRVPKHNNDDEHAPRIKVGDIILVTLDMDKEEIHFEINDKHIWTLTDIETDEVYYPGIWFLPSEPNQSYECRVNVKCCLH